MAWRKSKKRPEERFEYLDRLRVPSREPLAEGLDMMFDLWRFHREVDQRIGIIQSISIASTSSTIGIGWASLFYGLGNDQ